jgi:hypothetical protein
MLKERNTVFLNISRSCYNYKKYTSLAEGYILDSQRRQCIQFLYAQLCGIIHTTDLRHSETKHQNLYANLHVNNS